MGLRAEFKVGDRVTFMVAAADGTATLTAGEVIAVDAEQGKVCVAAPNGPGSTCERWVAAGECEAAGADAVSLPPSAGEATSDALGGSARSRVPEGAVLA